MEIKIEYAVCADCEKEIGTFDHAVVLKDGEILCKRCYMAYLDGAFEDALGNVAEVTTGRRLAKKHINGEERIVMPRGREIA